MAHHTDHHIILCTVAGQELAIEDLDDQLMFELSDPEQPEVRERFYLSGHEVAELSAWLRGWMEAKFPPHPRIDPRHPSQYRDN